MANTHRRAMLAVIMELPSIFLSFSSCSLYGTGSNDSPGKREMKVGSGVYLGCCLSAGIRDRFTKRIWLGRHLP